MAVNVVVQSGLVKSLALRYGSDGKPELRFTLDQEENGFHLWLPCFAVSAAAERVGEAISEGDHIVITSGRLSYRKRQTKLGEQSRLEILVWSVDRLTASTGDERSATAAIDDTASGAIVEPEPATVPSIFDTPAPKARKPRYPKWQASAN